MRVKVRIKRYDPDRGESPHWAEYEVEAKETDLVLDALKAIKNEIDGTLAFRHSCGHGICGSDAMNINGKNTLACRVLLKNAGPLVVIEPLPAFPVIKDLIVDLEEFFKVYQAMKPFLTTKGEPPVEERLQSIEERHHIEDTTRCILCACCTSACPSYQANPAFVGPAAIVTAHRFLYDSRDEGTEMRLKIMNDPNGVWPCKWHLKCNEVCPRSIKISRAIGEIRRTLRVRSADC